MQGNIKTLFPQADYICHILILYFSGKLKIVPFGLQDFFAPNYTSNAYCDSWKARNVIPEYIQKLLDGPIW